MSNQDLETGSSHGDDHGRGHGDSNGGANSGYDEGAGAKTMSSEDIQFSLVFPVYKDERTVRRVAEKAVRLFNSLSKSYEIIIVNDGSPDDSGKIADEVAAENSNVRVIHHKVNRGYGAAIKSGLKSARGSWICLTDGDDEYDVFDFLKLMKHMDYYDLIITFRYVKLYSSYRQFVSFVFNRFFRFLFKTPFRDISTGLKMVRSSLIQELKIKSDGPLIGGEITVRTMLKGYRVGEVGIQTFPREFGSGSSVTVRNILATIRDMVLLRKEIFSPEYDLPVNRQRSNATTLVVADSTNE